MFNILSFDGGGIRGIISGTVIDYMERYSYNYSRDNYCYPYKETNRVSMAELFDMVAVIVIALNYYRVLLQVDY
jgi:patatin-like phospholipase/acyl hydrolase